MQIFIWQFDEVILSQRARFMVPTWGPPGSCRLQMGPICWSHEPCYQGMPLRISAWSPVNSPHKGQWRGTWCFLWSMPEQTVNQTVETPAIWDATMLIKTSLSWISNITRIEPVSLSWCMHHFMLNRDAILTWIMTWSKVASLCCLI